MYQFLTKNGQALAFGLGLLLIIVFLATALPSAGNYNFETMEADQVREVSIFNFGLYSAIALVVLAAIGMVLFGVLQIAGNLKNSWKGILGFAGMVVIFIIAFSIASGDPETAAIQNSVSNFESSQGVEMSTSNLKFIGAGITTAIVMAGLAVLALVVTGVRSFFQ